MVSVNHTTLLYGCYRAKRVNKLLNIFIKYGVHICSSVSFLLTLIYVCCLVFYDARIDISCEEAKTDFEEESCFVFAPSCNALARNRSRSKCFLCIFVYFMNILLRYCWWCWWWKVFFKSLTFLFN